MQKSIFLSCVFLDGRWTSHSHRSVDDGKREAKREDPKFLA